MPPTGHAGPRSRRKEKSVVGCYILVVKTPKLISPYSRHYLNTRAARTPLQRVPTHQRLPPRVDGHVCLGCMKMAFSRLVASRRSVEMPEMDSEQPSALDAPRPLRRRSGVAKGRTSRTCLIARQTAWIKAESDEMQWPNMATCDRGINSSPEMQGHTAASFDAYI